MTSKINVSHIVGDHFRTLRDEATNKLSLVDIVVMVVTPLAIGFGVALLNVTLTDNVAIALVSVFSVFTGLLFNVLVLIYGIDLSSDDIGEDRGKLRRRLVQQSFCNISFSIISSLSVVSLLAISLFVSGLMRAAIFGLTVAIALNFVLTLLMVLKRMHILLLDRLHSR